MLHRFAFENFQSFQDRAELSFRLNGKVPRIPMGGAAGRKEHTACCVLS